MSNGNSTAITPAAASAVTLALLLGAGLLLSACGKKGPPEPQGPANQITYPRTYPSR